MHHIAEIILGQRYEMESVLYPHLLASSEDEADKDDDPQDKASMTNFLASRKLRESLVAILRSDKARQLRIERSVWK